MKNREGKAMPIYEYQCHMCGERFESFRGINDDDLVRIFNDRGQVIIPAKVSLRIMPGVVDVPQGAWYEPDENGIDRGGCANTLTRDEYSPGGACCTNTALVQVEKA